MKKITLLGSSVKILWKRHADGLKIRLPKQIPDQPVIGFKLE